MTAILTGSWIEIALRGLDLFTDAARAPGNNTFRG
jgi:hypothetical protein